MRRWGLVLAVLLGCIQPAWAEAAVLARPDVPITLKVDEVSLPALLVFLARVGGSDLVVEPAVTGTVKHVSFSEMRVEDAFRGLLLSEHLAVKQVGGKLTVTHGEPMKAPLPPINPAPARPELIVP